jgi:hypothetical protein
MRFYALLRESSDPQEREKGLTRQWRQLRRFCETWRGGPHEIALSVQIMESATRGYREEWQNAVGQGIELFQQGVIDAILFPEVDRETRNPLISVPILNLALDAGVPVFFAGEDLLLDPRDHDAVERYTDAASKSCAYLATMVKKCRAGRFDRAEQDGKLPCDTKIFGFDIVDGRRVPNQAQAAALKEAAQIALRQGRLNPPVNWLNEMSFRTTQGKPFTRATLRGLFRNRALTGETTINFKEKTVVLKHDGILDVATFEALQAILDERRRTQRSEVFYALSSLVYCGDDHLAGDGGGLPRYEPCYGKFEPTKTGPNRYYYRCKNHCGEKAWRKDDLEWEVHEAFSRYLEKRESQREYLELAQQSRAKLEKDLTEIEHSIDENDREWRILLKKSWQSILRLSLVTKSGSLPPQGNLCSKPKPKSRPSLVRSRRLIWLRLS